MTSDQEIAAFVSYLHDEFVVRPRMMQDIAAHISKKLQPHIGQPVDAEQLASIRATLQREISYIQAMLDDSNVVSVRFNPAESDMIEVEQVVTPPLNNLDVRLVF